VPGHGVRQGTADPADVPAGQAAAVCFAALQRLPQPREVALRRQVPPGKPVIHRCGCVVRQPRGAALSPVRRPAPARPAASDRQPGPALCQILRQPRQLALDGVTPQGHQPVKQRVPHPQRLGHHGDLRAGLPVPHGGRSLPGRLDAHHRPGGRGRPGKPRREAQSAHPRPQFADQVQRGLGLLMVKQPGHDEQRGILGELNAVCPPGKRLPEPRPPGIAQVPQVDPLPFGPAGRPAGNPAGNGQLIGSQRRLGGQPARCEAAVGDIQRHPRWHSGHRRPGPDRQRAVRHARQHRTPAGDLRLQPGPVRRVRRGRQVVDRTLKLAHRIPWRRGSSGLVRHQAPHITATRPDLEAGFEPAPSR
jgi:hypothetical protein